MGSNRVVIVSLHSKHSMAAYNRLVGYLKGLTELGVDAKLVLFMTHDMQGYQPPMPGIEYFFFPEPKSKIHRLLSTSRTYIRNLKKIIRRGDNVLFYDVRPELMYPFFGRKDIVKAIEITENPDVLREKTGLLNRFLFKFFPYFIKRADKLFVISDLLKDYFIKDGVPQDRIHRINMFVDYSRFDDVRNLVPEEKYIAYCGTVTVYKDGVLDLIKAFKIFAAKHPDYKLYIIGKFLFPADEEALNEMVDELGLADKVVFTGQISPDEMPAELCGAEILALARPNNTQAQYGFPTKLGEYLSTGKPVVVTRVGELDHFLTDYQNCRFAQPDNPEDFAEKLCWVSEHSDEAKQIAKNGLDLVATDFSYKTQSKKILDALSEIATL